MAWTDSVVDAVKGIVGGAQVDYTWGTGGSSGRVTLGEDRVLSWQLIAAAVAIAFLVGMQRGAS